MAAGLFTSDRSLEGPDALGLLGEDINHLANAMHRRFEELSSLQTISEQVQSGILLEEVLDRTYEAFRSLIPYDRIGCALLNKERSALTARWAKTTAASVKISVGYTQPLAGSSLEGILATGKPRIINDLEAYLRDHPGSASTAQIVAEGIRSSLTCPLIALGHPVGFLFFSSSRAHSYQSVHQDLFMRIAGQLSIVIEKSMLYEDLLRLNRELSEARQLLEIQATHDALTGLLNRRAVMDRLPEEISRAHRSGRAFATLMCDIDLFKKVNDTLGHLGGDYVLKSVARALKEACRDHDVVARYGGEEFLILMLDLESIDPACLAERARRAVQDLPLTFDGHPIRVTVSVGAAAFCAQSEEPADALLKRADEALYAAKHSGRNRCVTAPVRDVCPAESSAIALAAPPEELARGECSLPAASL